MSDQDNTQPTDESQVDEQTQSTEALEAEELAALKARAGQMGIQFSPKIGLKTLRDKVNAALVSGDNSAANAEPVADTEEPKEETPLQRRTRIRAEQRKEQLKLVRVRIANLDPSKKDLPGEIFSVSNKYLGTIKKFIPFGEATDNGYHVPFILYNSLKDRKFLQKRTTRGPEGEIVLKTNWVPEFAMDVLPPLTEAELKQLANQQAAAVGLGTV